MDLEDFVRAGEFCTHHNIEVSFIQTLNAYGLIETLYVEEQLLLPVSELVRLEKIIRLHFELKINIEGIEAINDLLDRMETMQKEIAHLKSRLNVYER